MNDPRDYEHLNGVYHPPYEDDWTGEDWYTDDEARGAQFDAAQRIAAWAFAAIVIGYAAWCLI